MYLIYSPTDNGSVGLVERLVGGERIPSASYTQDGHFFTVSCYEDACAICDLPGYRLATAEEQNAARASKAPGTLHEAPVAPSGVLMEDAPAKKLYGAAAKAAEAKKANAS